MAQKYKIEYSYSTGDSFGSRDEVDILEYNWDTLELAKEALQRIKEHYVWYESLEGYDHNKVEKPKWHYVVTEGDEHYLLNIQLDKDTEIQFCPLGVVILNNYMERK